MSANTTSTERSSDEITERKWSNFLFLGKKRLEQLKYHLSVLHEVSSRLIQIMHV